MFIAACCLVFGGQGLVANSMSMYITPLCYVTGEGVGTIGLALSLMALAKMILLPFVGKILKTFPLRPLLIVLVIGTMSAFIALGYVSSLPLVYALFAVLGACQAIPVYIMGPTLVTNWFEAKKGTLTSVMLLFGNLGGIVGAISAGMLLGAEPYNTQLAFTVMGGIAMAVMLVGAAMAIMHPALAGFKPYGAIDEPATENSGDASESTAVVEDEVVGIPAAKAVKSLPFYCIFLMVFVLIFCACFASLLGNFTVSLGFANSDSALVTTAFQIAAAIGVLTWGVLDDKIGVKKTSFIAFALLALGLFGFAFLAQASFVTLIGCALLFGFGGSSVGLQFPLLTSKFFGQKEYGSILSKLQIAQSAAGLIATSAIALVAQLTGSYTPALVFLGFFVIVAMVAVGIGVPAAKKMWSEEGIEPPKM